MPKRYLIKYVSPKGIAVDFNSSPYIWETTDLLNYSWKYESVDKQSGYGALINKTSKGVQSKSLTLAIYNGGASIDSDVSFLSRAFEADIISKTPGKIYIGDNYITCYVIGSMKYLYKNAKIAHLDLEIVTGSPFWIDESLARFDPLETTALLGFILPTKLPLAVAAPQIRTLVNDHYTDSSAIITMYGEVTDPEFYVGNHLYKVTGELILGERIEIDQMQKTVTKITTEGSRVNFFANRNKTSSVFTPIPPGENFIYSNNDFTFDILLMRERSEPVWT